MLFFFFFQAEDGIRDADVTGVQTCALPISCLAGRSSHAAEVSGSSNQLSTSSSCGVSRSTIALQSIARSETRAWFVLDEPGSRVADQFAVIDPNRPSSSSFGPAAK